MRECQRWKFKIRFWWKLKKKKWHRGEMKRKCGLLSSCNSVKIHWFLANEVKFMSAVIIWIYRIVCMLNIKQDSKVVGSFIKHIDVFLQGLEQDFQWFLWGAGYAFNIHSSNEKSLMVSNCFGMLSKGRANRSELLPSTVNLPLVTTMGKATPPPPREHQSRTLKSLVESSHHSTFEKRSP